ncbi:MAG: rubredoxin, partial [Lachnospiraceae bacterium]
MDRTDSNFLNYQWNFEDLPDDWKCPICGMPKA